ncbi:MAG: hypothetical protein F6K50_17685 [Moorea sp. SIO3I7]|nr:MULTISPECIES: hypothetical protein [unclassified Moorena]NEN97291.1 hypothetical protein [Moorena sp. SIO3I7]NEO09506.1 hypothetical protein [Moorena sp. SIO3I8]NEO18382.1 hypothetical protein [Moorena sp. SIO4A5]NEQ61960.1 hypothetical protein [Moorena sp. SIO4A1]
MRHIASAALGDKSVGDGEMGRWGDGEMGRWGGVGGVGGVGRSERFL